MLALAASVVAASTVSTPALTQQERTPLELERAGRLPEAVDAYRAALERDSTDVALLLGLERVLQRLDRLSAIRPYVARAVQGSPRNQTIREVQFRVAAALDGSDSVAFVAAQWMIVDPSSEGPYRAWSQWLAQQGDLEGARVVIEQGRARLGPDRLTQYGAQYSAMSGDWSDAARQWAGAVRAATDIVVPAHASLRRAPEPVREEVLATLADGPLPAGDWIAAFLLVSWNRPEEGWALLDMSLPDEDAQAALLLRRFADRAGEPGTSPSLRARGLALERLAEVSVGSAADRARLDAARAFADAGNLAGAQRMLDRLTVASDTSSRAAAAAMATFIQVLSDAGRVREAEERFREWEPRLSGRDAERVRETLAWGWLHEGDFDRAEASLGEDSTVGAQAIRGWASLYRGDLAAAKERLREAGPYAQSRVEATRRSRVLVLLQRVRSDRLPELGEALLAVAQRDTARAVQRLERAAQLLPPTGGRAEVLVLAGELMADAGDTERVESLLLAALAAEPEGPSAPGAELALASLYASAGRAEDAIRQLEHLVLSFPESAVVPQARRLLDRVRGAIPSS